MRCDFEVPSFTGFYQGIWDQSENEYNEIQMRKYDDNGFEHLNFLDDWGFGPDYRDKIAKLFAEEYVDIMKRYLGIDIELVGYDIDSPKEYYFPSRMEQNSTC